MNQKDIFESLKNIIQSEVSDRQLNQWAQIYYEDCVMTEYRSCPSLEDVAEQLKNGKPIQYIVNNARFYDLDLYVDEHVLIPRPETEELVFKVDEHINSIDKRAIDLGTGCGCAALLLKKLNPGWDVEACDVSEHAVGIARKNARKLGLDVHFFVGDILKLEAPTEDDKKYDIIISNPPYIPKEEVATLMKSVRENEPHLALEVSDDNPCLFYEAIANYALKALRSHGNVFCELHPDYGTECAEFFKPAFDVNLIKDMQGKLRFLHAQLRK